MATVNITLSQDTVNLRHDGYLFPSLYDTLGAVANATVVLEDELAKQPIVSWTLSGTTLSTTLADGATVKYTGFVQRDATLAQGAAMATGVQLEQKGLMTFAATGNLHLDYVLTSNPGKASQALALATADAGWMIDNLQVTTDFGAGGTQTHVGASDNVTASVQGALTLLPSGQLYGSVSSLTGGNPLYLKSAAVEGTFNVDLLGAPTALNGIADYVSGRLAGYSETYLDGGKIQVSGGVGSIDASHLAEAWASPTYLGGNDDIRVDLPNTLYASFVVAAGAGNDRIAVRGGGGDLHVAAGTGDDVIALLGGDHTVDGGAGLDTVQLQGTLADFKVQHVAAPDALPFDATGTVFSATGKNGTVATLVNVERLAFDDGMIALDADGNAGAIYRLYQAALNRQPDSAGLGFWIDVIDRGASLRDIAQDFLGSAEFKAVHGSALTSAELVTVFYNNCLHRAPDAGGFAFWTGLIDNHKADVADVLAAISESPEDKAILIGVIGDGFSYTPYVHG